MVRIALITLGLLLAGSAFAQLYKQVDEQGRVTYSDAPPSENAQLLELPPPNLVPGLPARPVFRPPEPSQPAPGTRTNYTRLSFVEPRNDQAIRANEGVITVRMDLQPPLLPGDRLEIRLDGKVVALGTDTEVTITVLDRGTHQLSASVKDLGSSTRIAANPIIFHLQRHSVLFRNR